MASPFLTLAFLALLAFPLAAAAASQPPALSRLHSAWSFSANSSLPILLSASRSYSWQFYTPRLDPSLRFLVVLSTRFNTTVVWTANRNHPVSPRATLSLGSDGKLLLKDSDGFVAWSTENSSGIKMALMNDTGNLLMLSGNDTARDVVWQSFDHPTDTMVVGQRLITGTTATASVSWDSFAEGNFSLKAEPGGGVLYASLNGEAHVPYQLLNYIVQDSTLQGALHSVCNRTDVLYAADGSSVSLVQEEMTPQCQAANAGIQIHSVQFSTRKTGDGYRFLKLDPDGDVRAYFQSAQTGQIVDNEFFGGYYNTLCKLPTYCGSYGLCSGVKNCSCPNGVDFRPVNPSDLRQGCALLHPLNCTNATAVSYQQLRVLQGVDYYANTYTTQRITTTEECQASCLSNCSCVAAFYKSCSRVCYHYGSIATMEYNSDPTVTAFLKVVGSPPRPKRNNARLIVGLFVGG